MSENYKEQLKNWLANNFPGVKLTETDAGYKFNITELSPSDISALAQIQPIFYKATVRRSGNGLVVIIS